MWRCVWLTEPHKSPRAPKTRRPRAGRSAPTPSRPGSRQETPRQWSSTDSQLILHKRPSYPTCRVIAKRGRETSRQDRRRRVCPAPERQVRRPSRRPFTPPRPSLPAAPSLTLKRPAAQRTPRSSGRVGRERRTGASGGDTEIERGRAQRRTDEEGRRARIENKRFVLRTRGAGQILICSIFILTGRAPRH